MDPAVLLQKVLLVSEVFIDRKQNSVKVTARTKSDYKILQTAIQQTKNFTHVEMNDIDKAITFFGLNVRSYIYLGAVERDWVKWMDSDLKLLIKA